MKLDLDAIAERCEEATSGPWTTFHPKLRYCANDVCADRGHGDEPFVLAQMNRHMDKWKDDAEFIAHARSDIPDLLAFAREAKAALEFYEFQKGPNGDNAREVLQRWFGEA